MVGDARTYHVVVGDARTYDIVVGDARTYDVVVGDARTYDIVVGDSRTYDVVVGDALTYHVVVGDALTYDVVVDEDAQHRQLAGVTGDFVHHPVQSPGEVKRDHHEVSQRQREQAHVDAFLQPWQTVDTG